MILQIGLALKKHSIMEDSIKLYRQLTKVKKSHRSILDSQIKDVRMLEMKFPEGAQLQDTKPTNLNHYLVKKMVSL